MPCEALQPASILHSSLSPWDFGTMVLLLLVLLPLPVPPVGVTLSRHRQCGQPQDPSSTSRVPPHPTGASRQVCRAGVYGCECPREPCLLPQGVQGDSLCLQHGLRLLGHPR
ncbi:uncharacterized protein LOC102571173 [Alligator mississippiensis]|uniref:uncharacterized protein LOC102571173 n=1 Tax=Alligator mississippiensis TaxID=8496 RepID=UPI0028780A08|nr:uncharacterized protein LOC102571173 [Alligator mississippiensis]XP_059589091.1 uncharacterized protein LOC102571173 [Alligator mississippiensis]